MTIAQLRRRLREQHARMGFEGRLALTLELDERGDDPDSAYVTHWFRPQGAAFEECVAVGHGTLEACLAAVGRYAEAYRPRPSLEELGRTIGLPPQRPVHPPAARHSLAAE